MMTPNAIFWFRRDLRLHDNRGLYEALRNHSAVLPVFIFDTHILDELPQDDKRVAFIQYQINELKKKLEKEGSSLYIRYGKPEEEIPAICAQHPSIEAVYANHDYEPYATQRDHAIFNLLKNKNIAFKTYKDQVIFEKLEVTKADGKPYTVFTPYKNKWLSLLSEKGISVYDTLPYFSKLVSCTPIPDPVIPFASQNPSKAGSEFPEAVFDTTIISNYDTTRNFPAQNGTTRLGVHLRFGTLSIRSAVQQALQLNQIWLSELIWREFYMMILWNYPHVVHAAFKPAYDAIPWLNSPENLERWKTGTTGYPIVDAGMRELNATGYMHNRVRMVAASFLTKHLLIDWRLGEAYFAEKLLDFELASNNGGWQWSASTGCDAAPYFRIFNPYEQAKKFDSKLEYINKWIPELNELHYPKPIVAHDFARKRAIETYRKYLAQAK